MKLKADFQVNKITSTLNTSDILDKDMFGQENLTISDKVIVNLLIMVSSDNYLFCRFKRIF